MSQKNRLKHEQDLLPWPYSAAASLVNRLVRPASEKEMRTRDGFGMKCSASFAKLDPAGLWRKTSGGCSQLSLMPTGEVCSEEYSGTWPKMGIVQDGYASELEMSERRTGESGCSSWPTPRSCEAEGGPINNAQFDGKSWFRENKQGVRWGIKLKDAVAGAEKNWPTPRAGNPGSRKPGTGGKILAEEAKKWPTPNATDYKGASTRASSKDRPICDDDLPTRVERIWPTPHATCSTGPGKQGWQGGENIQTAVWGTPTASMSVRSDSFGDGRVLNPAEYVKQKGKRGQLNPAWVTLLMGFPADWLEIDGPPDGGRHQGQTR